MIEQDASHDVGARNHRKLSALYCGAVSGLEEVRDSLLFFCCTLHPSDGFHFINSISSCSPSFLRCVTLFVWLQLHGVVDRVMLLNGVGFAHAEASLRQKDLARAKQHNKDDSKDDTPVYAQ